MLLAGVNADAQAPAPTADSPYRLYMRFPALVRGGTVDAHWLPDGSSFWYVDSSARGAPQLFILDAARNTQREVGDTVARGRLFAGRAARQPTSGVGLVPGGVITGLILDRING